MKNSEGARKKIKEKKDEGTRITDSKDPKISKGNGEPSQSKKIQKKSKKQGGVEFKITKTRTLVKTIKVPVSKSKHCVDQLAEQPVRQSGLLKTDCDNTCSIKDNIQPLTTNPPHVEIDDTMEWEPSENEILSTLHSIRRDSFHQKHSGKTIIPNSLNKCYSSSEAVLHVIVDTNILLSHLPIVKMLLEKCESGKKIQIYIPWMVLQELDYMKTKNEKKNSIEILARKAASFLFEQIKNKNSSFRIQTLDEFKNCISLLSDENDDKILEWCLCLQKEGQCKMILLSNDIMFCAKASASGIESMPKEQFVENLPQFLDPPTSPIPVNPVAENMKTVTENHPIVKRKIEETRIFDIDITSSFLLQFKQLMQVPLSHVS